jgi:hypothetical protein
MRRRFSAVLPLPGSSHFSRAMYEEDPGDEVAETVERIVRTPMYFHIRIRM